MSLERETLTALPKQIGKQLVFAMDLDLLSVNKK